MNIKTDYLLFLFKTIIHINSEFRGSGDFPPQDSKWISPVDCPLAILLSAHPECLFRSSWVKRHKDVLYN